MPLEPSTRDGLETDLLRGLPSRENEAEAQKRSELKVRIPMHMHVKLHSLRILRGQSLSSTVEAALADYFDRRISATQAGTEAGAASA